MGYPGKAHGVTPDRLEMDYVKQVSIYQILNDMKIVLLLQKLVILVSRKPLKRQILAYILGHFAKYYKTA